MLGAMSTPTAVLGDLCGLYTAVTMMLKMFVVRAWMLSPTSKRWLRLCRWQ